MVEKEIHVVLNNTKIMVAPVGPHVNIIHSALKCQSNPTPISLHELGLSLEGKSGSSFYRNVDHSFLLISILRFQKQLRNLVIEKDTKNICHQSYKSGPIKNKKKILQEWIDK